MKVGKGQENRCKQGAYSIELYTAESNIIGLTCQKVA